LQPLARCPRCGYALIYDGRTYRCGFCGYANNRQPAMASMRNFERRLRLEIETFLQRARRERYQRMIVQHPSGTGEQLCGTCGLRIPTAVQNCPYCGAQQRTIQTGPGPHATPVTTQSSDQLVLDYIAAHNGTISISTAAKDLSMSSETLRLTLERLKTAGLLKPV
jgi:ribosomal protein L37E